MTHARDCFQISCACFRMFCTCLCIAAHGAVVRPGVSAVHAMVRLAGQAPRAFAWTRDRAEVRPDAKGFALGGDPSREREEDSAREGLQDQVLVFRFQSRDAR